MARSFGEPLEIPYSMRFMHALIENKTFKYLLVFLAVRFDAGIR